MNFLVAPFLTFQQVDCITLLSSQLSDLSVYCFLRASDVQCCNCAMSSLQNETWSYITSKNKQKIARIYLFNASNKFANVLVFKQAVCAKVSILKELPHMQSRLHTRQCRVHTYSGSLGLGSFNSTNACLMS